MKLNLVFLLVAAASAIKIKNGGKSFIHLKLIEDPPAAPVADDGAKAPGKDLDAPVVPRFEYGTSTRAIPEPHGTKELKVYNGKPDPVPLQDSWPGANGENPEGSAAPKDGAAKAAPKATQKGDAAKPADAAAPAK